MGDKSEELIKLVTAAQWLPSAVGTEVEWKDLDDIDAVAGPHTEGGQAVPGSGFREAHGILNSALMGYT